MKMTGNKNKLKSNKSRSFLFVECNKCANQMDIGSTGLPTYDLIHEFQFSEFAQNEEIMGSIASQHAYHILSESNWTRYTTDVLPRGIPYHFWFEATYRSQLQSEQPWYLFHVTNAFDVTQISITFDTANQLIGIGLPDTMGNVQHVFFRHSTAFDHAWHKIFVNVLNDQVQVWIDCQQAVGVRGEFAEPLLPRRQFETNGRTYIARYVDEANYYSVSKHGMHRMRLIFLYSYSNFQFTYNFFSVASNRRQ